MVWFYETQTSMSISEILLRNIDEKINMIVEKDHQFLLLEDTMHIWTYGIQKLVMKICI